MTILVTGVTGYVGGRLVPLLLRKGHTVKCLIRDANRIPEASWSQDVEFFVGDVLKYDSLTQALSGVDIAYYLIHSMASSDQGFEERDVVAAKNFGRAAHESGVKRIIYLGGIRPKTEKLSRHLQSRLHTGEYLRESGVSITEFRAAAIVGSGSLSFELIRYLTERVPILITPKWVRTPTQPIAIRNVLSYLVAAIDNQESVDQIIEIGGRDILTYGQMFAIYARLRGLHRPIINVPVLTPKLSSLWVGLVTPVNSSIARPLIEGLDNEVVLTDSKAEQMFGLDLLTYEEAVRKALERFETDTVETMWSGAYSSGPGKNAVISSLTDLEGMITEKNTLVVEAHSATFIVLSLIWGVRPDGFTLIFCGVSGELWTH